MDNYKNVDSIDNNVINNNTLTHDIKWKQHFNEVKNYIEKYNTLPSYIQSASLYTWIYRQKVVFNEGMLQNNRLEKLFSVPLLKEFLLAKNKYIIVHNDDTKDIAYTSHCNSWQENYNLLLEWKKQRQNILEWPAQRSTDEIEHKLGVWLLRIRKEYKDGKLNEELKKKLEEIDFIFDPYTDKWDIKYGRLVKLMNNEYNNIDENEKNKIIAWLRTQVNNFNNLTPWQQDKIAKYKHLCTKRNDDWNECFIDVYKFVLNNDRLPNKDDDNELFKWLLQQRNRYRNGKMDNKKLTELLKIQHMEEFIFEVFKTWEDHFNDLDNFIKINGRLPSQIEDESLYIWIYMQKSAYNNDKLDEERKNKLLNNDTIKAFFNLPVAGRHKRIWSEYFNNLCNFINDNQRIPTSLDDIHLYSWLYTQKLAYIRGKLDDEEKDKLINNDAIKAFFDIPVASRHRGVWEDYFNTLYEFVKNNGRLPENIENKKLYNWLANQKFFYKHDILDENRKNKLFTIEIVQKYFNNEKINNINTTITADNSDINNDNNSDNKNNTVSNLIKVFHNFFGKK